LIDRRSGLRSFDEDAPDEAPERFAVRRLGREAVADIQDGKRPTAVFLEWGGVVAELVEQNAKRPDVGWLTDGDGWATVDVDHLGSAILEGGVPVQVGLECAGLIH